VRRLLRNARHCGCRSTTARQCAANGGDLLPYITTANVAHDMDGIRRALGERTVSYNGISWGTHLGSIYRALFPRTIDRMMIDSSVDPDKQGYDDFRSFSFAMEDRWPDLAKFGVDNAGTVHLGTTAAQVRKHYLALADEHASGVLAAAPVMAGSECFGSLRVVDRRGLTVLFTSKAPPHLDIQPTPADDAWLSAGPPGPPTRTGARADASPARPAATARAIVPGSAVPRSFSSILMMAAVLYSAGSSRASRMRCSSSRS
jgi:pimeloyl-ACP methyl ester carboxylesterase